MIHTVFFQKTALFFFIFLFILSVSHPVFAQDDSGVGFATASEWENFDYAQVGLTQWEFQQAKEAGMTKDKLLSLLEIGVRPGEYLQRPWERLNVSEREWVEERSQGMEDSDIDRSYRYKTVNQDAAYMSLLLPGYYQWKTGKSSMALGLEIAEVALLGGFSYLVFAENNTSGYYLIPLILGIHVWSFADAWSETRFENNPDAGRFSWGIAPTPNHGFVSGFLLKF
jgi:hypothetical protein